MAFCFTLSVLRTGKGALQAGQKTHNHSVTSILDRIEDESDPHPPFLSFHEKSLHVHLPGPSQTHQ